jgi:hypothetical protein
MWLPKIIQNNDTLPDISTIGDINKPVHKIDGTPSVTNAMQY